MILLIVKFILFYMLLFLMYVGYNVVVDKELIVMKKDDGVEPDPKALGYCTIERDDLFSGSVYDSNKKKMTTNMSPIKCSDCNQYVYKTGNQCSSYMYNTEYNSLAPNIDDSSKLSVFCDPAHPERAKNCIKPHGVCTLNVNAPSKTCKF